MRSNYWLLAAVFAIGCSSLGAQTYTFQIISSCDSIGISPYAMNALGTVVGAAYNSGDPVSSAFVYDIATGACTIYPYKSGTSFTAISETGEIVGVDAAGSYLLKNGKIQQLPNFPNASATTYCCFDSSTGTLAGIYQPGGVIAAVYPGFFYQQGKFKSLPWNFSTGAYVYQLSGLNNRGVTVGTFSGSYTLGFILQNEKMTLVNHPGSGFTYFGGLNDNNIVVGNFYSNVNPSGYFLYNIDANTWTDISLGTSGSPTPIGITNTGIIAASYDLGAGLLIATPTGN